MFKKYTRNPNLLLYPPPKRQAIQAIFHTHILPGRSISHALYRPLQKWKVTSLWVAGRLQPKRGGGRNNNPPQKRGERNVSGRVPSGGEYSSDADDICHQISLKPSCQLLLYTRVVSLVYGKHKRYTIVFYKKDKRRDSRLHSKTKRVFKRTSGGWG